MFDHGMPRAAILVADQTRSKFQFVCAIMVFVAVPVLMLTRSSLGKTDRQTRNAPTVGNGI